MSGRTLQVVCKDTILNRITFDSKTFTETGFPVVTRQSSGNWLLQIMHGSYQQGSQGKKYGLTELGYGCKALKNKVSAKILLKSISCPTD